MKRILSVILSLAMLFTMVIPASAIENNCQQSIDIDGVMYQINETITPDGQK